MAVFLIWSNYQNARLQQERQRQAQLEPPPGGRRGDGEPRRPGPPRDSDVVGRPDEVAKPEVDRPQWEYREQTLRSGDFLEVRASSRGIERVVLPDYPDKKTLLELAMASDVNGDSRPLVLLPEVEKGPRPLALGIVSLRSSLVDTSPEQWPPLEEENWELVDSAGENVVLYRTQIDETGAFGDDSALEITREIRLVPDSNYLEVRVSFRNRAEVPRELQYRLWGPIGIGSEATRGAGSDLLIVAGQFAMNGPPIMSTVSVAGAADWSYSANPCTLGLQNNYFTALLSAVDETAEPFGVSTNMQRLFARVFPDPHFVQQLLDEKDKGAGRKLEDLSPTEREELDSEAYKTAAVGLTSDIFSVEPGDTVVHRYVMYLGPREDDRLARFKKLNLEATNDYGWFTGIVRLFLVILRFFEGLCGSWGFSIVCLTLVVRTCLHPINKKQQMGMTKYQKKIAKIQPEMKRIQEEFKDDRMAAHKETQKLFKEHDVKHSQMFCGCLMILLEFPIWIGLIRTLDFSIDLRQSPFLWFDDLAQPDRLLLLFEQPPFFLLPKFLNILPVLYVVLMIVQQRLQPRATDPQAQQTQRMMGFMMIAFGFIFYSFPSGLMVYFIASALYGLVESRLIRRRIAREEESEGGGAAAGITPSSSTTSSSTTPPTATSDAPVYTSKIGKRRKLTKTERKKAKGTYFKT